MNEPYRNPNLPVAERIEDLLQRMTLNEKIAQMLNMRGWTMYQRSGDTITVSDELVELYKEFPGAGPGSFFRADWYTGKTWDNGLTPGLIAKAANCIQRYAVENTRFGIPLLMGASIHGLMVLGGVVFPSGIGCGSTWDREVIKRAGDTVAEEALAINALACAGPTQDLARDPRWSRVEETFGEDPYLSAELTYAYGIGLRGDKTNRTHCFPSLSIRHFTGHGEPEGGHNTAPCHVGMNELFNIHMRPFEAGVAAGAGSLMSAYNLIDGIPCSINGDLLNGIVREKWGYKGTIVTDAGAIGALVENGYARDYAEAAAVSIKAGTDLCCWEGDRFKQGIIDAIERGILEEKDVNNSVRRILLKKFESGIFDHPYVGDETLPERIFSCPAHKQVALELARKSMVLLQNKDKALPLQAGIRKIAVIGPNADTPGNQLGDYTAPQRKSDIVTVRNGLEALQSKYGFCVAYAHGCGVRNPDRSEFDEAIRMAGEADVVVAVLGGSSLPDSNTGFLSNGAADIEKTIADTRNDKDSGEGYDRTNLNLGGVQVELLKELAKTGKKIITVLIMGRPLIMNDVCKYSDAVLLAWYPGMMGGQAVAEALLGEYNPGGKLSVSIPRNEGQLPVYYNTMRARPPYIDGPSTPLFRFGHGLSYTEFAISDVRPAKERMTADDDKNFVCCKVRNAGNLAGDAVVQMYVRDCIVSVARPLLELKGFERISLQPGETREVKFQLGSKELGFYNRRLEYVVEPGDFDVSVGLDSENLIHCKVTVN